MVRLQLDARGRLVYFERIPAQLQPPAKETTATDWSALFAAAGLDQSKFQPAEPLWTTLAASDTRMAWTRSCAAAATRGGSGTARAARVLHDDRAVDQTGPHARRFGFNGADRDFRCAGDGACGDHVGGSVAGGRQFAPAARRPARSAPAGRVHILRTDGAVGGAHPSPRFIRHVRNVSGGARHQRVLRRGDVDRVYGTRAVCPSPLAADTDIVVGCADRPDSRCGGGAGRVDWMRGGCGADGDQRALRDLAAARGRMAEPGRHCSADGCSRISGGGVAFIFPTRSATPCFSFC